MAAPMPVFSMDSSEHQPTQTFAGVFATRGEGSAESPESTNPVGVFEDVFVRRGRWRKNATDDRAQTNSDHLVDLAEQVAAAYSFSLIWKLVRAILLPFCVDMLPIIQSIPFAVESLYWFYHGMGVPECPNNALYKFDDPQFYFCWFAGGFNLAWPMILPIGLVIVASYFMVAASFIEPSDKDKQDKQKLEGSTSEVEGSGAIWHNEDGDVHATCGSKRLTLLGYVLFDVVVMLPIVMPIFGVIPAVMAYWNTLVRGNRFNFVSAAKGVATQPVVAVTMTSRLEQERNVGAAIVGQTHQGDQGDQNMV